MVKRKSWIVLPLALSLALVTAACGSTPGTTETSATGSPKSTEAAGTNAEGGNEAAGQSGSGPVTLKFMYWGSAFEKAAVEKMLKAFEASHPNIKINAEHVPGDFATKINTLMATNELPDVSYLSEGLALKWAAEGKVLDMTPYMKQYPELEGRLKQSYYYFSPGKTVGTNTAGEMITLFYNKDLFKEAGLEPPPSDGAKAWTWEQFVDIARQLTKDKNGKTAKDAGFDPKNIVQYGVSVPTWSAGWYPFLLSNGADITNEDGTKYTLNSPEAVEVFQNIQDLMYKEHVAPTATQQQNMPATNVRLQTKKVAMAIDGQWALLDFASTKMNFGLGVLPKFKEPKTMFLGAPTVIFSNTKHPKEAMEFYLYHNNPEQVDLYKQGLWMPLEEKYYTDPAAIDSWTKNDAHPPEYKEAVIDYTLKYSGRSPSYSLKNFSEIEPKLLSAFDKIWTNKEPAKKVLDDLEAVIQPLLQGKYDK